MKSQKELIAVLTSPDSPPADKAITCKQLMRIGDAEAVPALAALLTDEQLAAWARIALEAIPDPAADEALREAASRLEGRLLVGVVNSIGMRRDAKAVDLLSKKLTDADAEVAAAAAVALGRIGDGAATGALEQFLKGPAATAAPPKVRSAVAEGCILCAEQSNRSGDAATAIRLFEAIRNADVPQQRVLEATRGVILTRKADGIPLLVELLHSDDRAQFELGLWVARELPGPEATAALVAELERTAPEQKALLMLALMDRQDRPPLSLLVQAAERGPKNVRITAIRAMRQKGDASCVPVLLAATVEADADVATAAAEALEELPGDDVNADLAKRLAAAQGKARLPLIELSGRRGIAAAVPELLQGRRRRRQLGSRRSPQIAGRHDRFRHFALVNRAHGPGEDAGRTDPGRRCADGRLRSNAGPGCVRRTTGRGDAASRHTGEGGAVGIARRRRWHAGTGRDCGGLKIERRRSAGRSGPAVGRLDDPRRGAGPAADGPQRGGQ